MIESFSRIIQTVPAWRERADIHTAFLSGGITNHNYRVDVGNESFVIRIGGAKTELLGIDRVNEHAAAKAAAEIGIAPEVVHFIQPEGYLITRFIRGRQIPPDEMCQENTIHEIARVLRKLHALAPLRATFSPFQVVRGYHELARENNVQSFPERYLWLRERLDEIESRLTLHAASPVPCHNDLLNGNFLRDDQGNICILDWEYAGMGDLFFDLAKFSARHDFTDEHIQELLAAYFEQVEPGAFAKLKLEQAISSFHSAMWGLVQQGISDLDFDFRGYADRLFDLLTMQLNDERYPQWMRLLSHG